MLNPAYLSNTQAKEQANAKPSVPLATDGDATAMEVEAVVDLAAGRL